MSFFGDQAVRMIKTRWKTPWALAQELYALFAGDPNLSAPTTVSQPDGSTAPFLKLENYTPGQDLIQITGRNGQPVGAITLEGDQLVLSLPEQPGFVGGNLTLDAAGTRERRRSSTTPDRAPAQPAKKVAAQPVAVAGAFPGKVVSGSGNLYQVDIYPNGTANEATRVTVKQLQIDPSASIPVGTWALVCKAGDEYSMQVPVILLGG